jgi:hypothetical protein
MRHDFPQSGRASIGDRGKCGHAAIELALMSPWLLLLFAAIFDFGFFAYAAINTQNAARAAVLATSKDPGSAASQATGCGIVREEMRMFPNITTGTDCTSLPLVVNVSSFADPETSPKLGSRVSVTYQTVQLFPLPFLMGRMTLTRVAEARVFGE